MIGLRETYYAALFSKVANLQSGGSKLFKTAERRLRHWSDVQPEDMPYIAQAQAGEMAVQKRGLATLWRLKVNLHIYVMTNTQGDQTAIPAQYINPLLDAVENEALKFDDLSNNVCTLNGLVSHCWINGEIITSEGTLGDLEVAVVPIEIFVPLHD